MLCGGACTARRLAAKPAFCSDVLTAARGPIGPREHGLDRVAPPGADLGGGPAAG